jgi:endonuclease YncB( thermonuclease family)
VLVVLSVSLAAGQTRENLLQFVNRTVPATVTSVVDGDTVHVRLADGKDITVRLHGIDAPERGEPYSSQARNATRVLLFEQRVQVRGMDVDGYDRLVARVTVGETDSSVELVKAGLACHLPRFSSDPLLINGQRDARASGRGFWAAGAPKPACATGTPRSTGVPTTSPDTTVRPLLPSAGARPSPPVDVVYHGNSNSRVYHAPSCPNYNCKNCTVVFRTDADAQRAGFRPAGDCLARR